MSGLQDDMRGKTAVLTGATGGIGRQVARAYAERGARLVLVGRDRGKLDALLTALPGGNHGTVLADLALVEGNRRAADEVMRQAPVVDLLLNVAGAIVGTRQMTSEGMELTLATNVLGPVALSEALLPALRRATHPRVVVTGSEALAFVRDPKPEDMQSEAGYRGFPGAYARAKAWLTMWALSDPLGGVPVVVADPGGTKTDMTILDALPLPIRLLRPFIMHGPEVAALAFLRAGADLPLAEIAGRVVMPKKLVTLKPRYRDAAKVQAVCDEIERFVGSQ
ncbi:MAG: SDR family NAD(P)-dependent oxidoreductase [Pseudomonadota bacterium]